MKSVQSFFEKAFLVFAMTVIVAGCSDFEDLALPEKISVKSDATFNAALGNAELTSEKLGLTDSLSANALAETMKGLLGNDVKVYDYRPNSTEESLRYLVYYPIYTVPIDIGSYLGNINLAETLNNTDLGFNLNTQFEIPDMSMSLSSDIASVSNLKTVFEDSFNNALNKMSASQVTVYEPGPGITFSTAQATTSGTGMILGLDDISIENQLSFTAFYSTGSKLLVTFTKTDSIDCTDNFSFLLGAKLSTKDGTLLRTIEDTEIKNGGSLEVPIDYETGLPSNLKISLSGSIAEGTRDLSDSNAHKHTYNISLALSDGATIRKITNLTATPEDLALTLPSVSTQIDMTDAAGLFNSAVIGEGYARIYSTLPENWSGISLNANISMAGAGFENAVLTDTVPPAEDTANYILYQKLDLADRALVLTPTDSKINVTGTFALSIKDATIDFENIGETVKLTAFTDCQITKLSSININLNNNPKLGDLDLSFSLPTNGENGSVLLPAEVIKHVKKIKFNEYKTDKDGNPTSTRRNGFGLTAKLVNSMPEGNSIPLTIHSDMFSYLQNVSIDGTASANPVDVSWTTYPTVDFTGLDSGVNNYIDLSVTVADSVTFVNLEPGQTYSFGLSDIGLVLDWDSIEFDSNSISVETSMDLTDLDIDALLNSQELPLSADALKAIKFQALPVYLYAQISQDNPLGNLGFGGSLELSYSYDDNGEIKNVTKNPFENGQIASITHPYNWPETGSIITDDISAQKKSGELDFSEMLNNRATNTHLDCNVGLSGTSSGIVTIYSDLLDSLLGNSKPVNISFAMALDLNLKLTLTDGISVDILNETIEGYKDDPTKDLLNREPGSDSFSLDDFSFIKSFKIGYTLKNNMLSITDSTGNDALKLTLVDANSGLNKTLNFSSSGTQTLELTRDEITSVMKQTVFHPEVKLCIGKENDESTLMLKRSIVAVPKEGEKPDPLLSIGLTVSVELDGENPMVIWSKDSDDQGGEN